MSFGPHPKAFSVRTFATAALIGAALLAGPASAQNAGSKPPAAAAATSSKPETVEQRIDTLKVSLKITSDEETKWNAVSQAMRDNAGNMEKLVAAKRAATAAGMTAVDDMATYQEFAQAHLDGLKSLSASFKALYDSMPDAQKKNADQVFQSYGPATAPTHG